MKQHQLLIKQAEEKVTEINTRAVYRIQKRIQAKCEKLATLLPGFNGIRFGMGTWVFTGTKECAIRIVDSDDLKGESWETDVSQARYISGEWNKTSSIVKDTKIRKLFDDIVEIIEDIDRADLLGYCVDIEVGKPLSSEIKKEN